MSTRKRYPLLYSFLSYFFLSISISKFFLLFPPFFSSNSPLSLLCLSLHPLSDHSLPFFLHFYLSSHSTSPFSFPFSFSHVTNSSSCTLFSPPTAPLSHFYLPLLHSSLFLFFFLHFDLSLLSHHFLSPLTHSLTHSTHFSSFTLSSSLPLVSPPYC